MAARFFIDADLAAVGRALALVRLDVVHPRHEELPGVLYETHDEDWLPLVGGLHGADLVVITRDKKIRTRPVERRTYERHKTRVFCLTGAGNLSNWETL